MIPGNTQQQIVVGTGNARVRHRVRMPCSACALILVRHLRIKSYRIERQNLRLGHIAQLEACECGDPTRPYPIPLLFPGGGQPSVTLTSRSTMLLSSHFPTQCHEVDFELYRYMVAARVFYCLEQCSGSYIFLMLQFCGSAGAGSTGRNRFSALASRIQRQIRRALL